MTYMYLEMGLRVSLLCVNETGELEKICVCVCVCVKRR